MLLFSQTASEILFPLCGGQEGKTIKHLLKEKLYIPVSVEKCELQACILKCRVKVLKFKYIVQLLLHCIKYTMFCVPKIKGFIFRAY